MAFSVAVAGASGYAGGELLRLLGAHPEFEVRTVTAFSNAGQRVTDVHPHLRALADLTFAETTPDALADHDVVFVALPHGQSGALTEHLPAHTLVVDCGADHRLTSAGDWQRFYGGDYHGAWTYGMPELVHADGSKQRDALDGARRIAVPGCNVTAVTLGLAPGIRSGAIMADDLVAVLAVGTSGAGKSVQPHLMASEIMGSASAYAVGGVHRHIPEIAQNFRVAGARNVTLSFTPVLVPMSRGILATSTARLAPGITPDEARQAWDEAYRDEPFVTLLDHGVYPSSSSVLGANTALVGFGVDEAAGRVVTITAIDNLTKGTAGAAIQSANLALGLPEDLGLSVDGVAP
ncbi:MAG: N-acetyl-gamma-glutamyl-phosphate reductase [Cryobacterium sp.]|nr:N-acetyl-gamma-glutamyl-phosphate reductase [Cryobacterium sp.]